MRAGSAWSATRQSCRRRTRRRAPQPGDILIDSTGANRRFETGSVPGQVDEGGNTLKIRLEYALVITFLYGQPYDCDEHCKYYKNIENPHYKFIPMVHRTHYDGSVSHVTGIVNITAEDYVGDAVPIRPGSGYAATFPRVAESMDRFIGKVKEETHGEVLGDLEVVRIPSICIARNATSRQWLTADRATTPSPAHRCSLPATRPSARRTFSRSRSASSVRCIWRDSWPSVTFRSGTCSIGTSCTYKQWLRVYMRSKMIKHNKDLFESSTTRSRPGQVAHLLAIRRTNEECCQRRAYSVCSSYRSRPIVRSGLERATPTFDEAPARVDQRDDEHRRHDCTDEEAQLRSRARSVCDEPHDDPGESCVDHRDERGSLADQAVEPAPRAWAVRLVQTLLVVVVARHEYGSSPGAISR